MNGRQLVVAGLVAIALGIGLLVLGSPSLGTQMNVLPLTLTNDASSLDAPGLRLSSNVTQTVTSTVNVTGSIQVATAISKYFSVTVESVTAMHDAGHGYGEIVKALSLARLLGDKTADDIFKLRAENQGWGKILKSLAVSKWDTSVGKVMRAQSNQETVDGNAPGNSGDHRQDQKKDKGNNGKDDGKRDDDQGDDKGNNGKGNTKSNNGKGRGGK